MENWVPQRVRWECILCMLSPLTWNKLWHTMDLMVIKGADGWIINIQPIFSAFVLPPLSL